MFFSVFNSQDIYQNDEISKCVEQLTMVDIDNI